MTGKSLYSEERECWLCQSPYVERHHIYGGHGRRPIADREGCWVYLCHEHHQGLGGVHQDSKLMAFFRSDCERRWCAANDKTSEDFLDVFGISYI